MRHRFDLMGWNRLLLVAACAMACVGVSAPIGAAAGSPRGSSVAIAGGTAAQRRLARLVALRVGGVTLRRVVFFRSPSRVFRPWHVHGSELEVLSSPGLAHGLLLRSEWEQELYVGTYLALAERDPNAAVAAVATAESAAPADRAAVYDGSGKPPTAAAVARQIGLLLNAAEKRGAQVVEARTISLPGASDRDHAQGFRPSRLPETPCRALPGAALPAADTAARLLRRRRGRKRPSRLGDVEAAERGAVFMLFPALTRVARSATASPSEHRNSRARPPDLQAPVVATVATGLRGSGSGSRRYL